MRKYSIRLILLHIWANKYLGVYLLDPREIIVIGMQMKGKPERASSAKTVIRRGGLPRSHHSGFANKDNSNCPATDVARRGKATDKRLLTIKEFSVRYGRSRSRIYQLIKSGELPAVKDGRSTLIPVDGAEAWARKLAQMSVPGE